MINRLVVVVQDSRLGKGCIGIGMSESHLTRMVLGEWFHPDACDAALQVDGELGQIFTPMGGNFPRLVVHLPGFVRHPSVAGQSGYQDVAAFFIFDFLGPAEEYLSQYITAEDIKIIVPKRKPTIARCSELRPITFPINRNEEE